MRIYPMYGATNESIRLVWNESFTEAVEAEENLCEYKER